MFLIKWRARECPPMRGHLSLYAKWLYGWRWIVRTGLSRYPTVEAAQQQIAIWSRIFPFNSYYVEPANHA